MLSWTRSGCSQFCKSERGRCSRRAARPQGKAQKPLPEPEGRASTRSQLWGKLCLPGTPRRAVPGETARLSAHSGCYLPTRHPSARTPGHGPLAPRGEKRHWGASAWPPCRAWGKGTFPQGKPGNGREPSTACGREPRSQPGQTWPPASGLLGQAHGPVGPKAFLRRCWWSCPGCGIGSRRTHNKPSLSRRLIRRLPWTGCRDGRMQCVLAEGVLAVGLPAPELAAGLLTDTT